jgi:ORF6N domain
VTSNENTEKRNAAQDAERRWNHASCFFAISGSFSIPTLQLYGVTVKRLNQQVARNQERFPSDFSFQLSSKEHESLRLQFATSKKTRRGRRYTPYAFTEH